MQFNWIIGIIIGLLVLFFLGYLLFQYGFTVIVAQLKKILGISNSEVYNLYGYQYVKGVRANGSVITTYDNVKSDLICANYAAATDKCVGANYTASTYTCELLSDLLPLMTNDSCETIVMSATNLRNKVSAFTSTPSASQPGVLFCDTSLAYLPYASALCANIPNCSGYITTFAKDTNAPIGCLLTKGEADSTISDTRATLYSGSRNDGILYNQSTNEEGPYYRWRTSVSGVATDVLNTDFVTTLDECGKNAQETIGAVAAVWDPDTDGTCTIYSALHPIVSDDSKTYITWKSNADFIKYSNNYQVSNGTDFPSALTVQTGLENSIAYTLRDAMIACVNTRGCNCIVHDTTTNKFVFYNLQSTDISSTDATKTAYRLPSTFT